MGILAWSILGYSAFACTFVCIQAGKRKRIYKAAKQRRAYRAYLRTIGV